MDGQWGNMELRQPIIKHQKPLKEFYVQYYVTVTQVDRLHKVSFSIVNKSFTPEREGLDKF